MVISTEPANSDTLDELWRIEQECFLDEAYSKQQIASLLKNPNAIDLIARVNGEIAGFVIGGIEDFGGRQVGHVYTIDVAVKHRRKGVGKRLLKDIENVFMNHCVKVIYLEVRANNEAARRLYETQGFRLAETIENYYSTGIHGLRMIKILRSSQKTAT